MAGFVFLVACNHASPVQDTSVDGAANGSNGSDGDVATDAGSGDGPLASIDPFAVQPDTSAGLTNTSADLNAVLENGTLAGACDRYWKDAANADRKSLLLCGKQMYFYETFGTQGVPKSFPKFLIDNFPDDVGAGFAKFGMVADPSSTDHFPLGLAPSAKFAGSLDAVAFTCASCHFAKLSDGRYSVGAPNHGYEYGKSILAMAIFPTAALSGTSGHDPDAVVVVQPHIDKANSNIVLKAALIGTLLPLITSGGMMPNFPATAEHHYAQWKSGTMDFLMEPLPVNDNVHVVSKISALWGLPTDDEIKSSGMVNAMIGLSGNGPSLLGFAQKFISVGGGDLAAWPDEKLQPLLEYVYSLRAPQNPSPPVATLVAQGKQLFADKGCTSCHDGPRGSGKRVYTFEEIGSDDALKYWLDPDLTGTPCCGFSLSNGDKLTHGVKSPRLVGQWALSRFLHNGSVGSLEDLFCVGGARGKVTDQAFGDRGHNLTCDGLSSDEKTALIAFLKSI